MFQTSDFEGNPIPFNGTNPDIGIYEYQPTLNIESYSPNDGIAIYPNPSKGYVRISSKRNDIYNLSIVNINGKQILDNMSLNEIIDLSFLLNGVYFMRFETSNGIILKKIISVN